MPALTALLTAGWVAAQGCAAPVGWTLQWEQTLPRQGPNGEAIGGFSAIVHEPQRGRLWLLSDLPQAELSAWTLPGPRWAPRLLLQRPIAGAGGEALDGEGLVLAGDEAWIASEGRRSDDRPALLLRVNRRDGRTLQRLPLPAPWQAAPGSGLASNAGPESLTRLSAPGAPLQLLMAAERPLLQDPDEQVRLLRWWWPAGRPAAAAPEASPQGALQLPGPEPWSLTDLLALPQRAGQPPRLLALLRRYTPPQRWDNRLALYPLPEPGAVVPPLRIWNLQQAGLSPENWEGLALGPPQANGRPSLLLVSDDNLNPLQSSRLALLIPTPPHACLEHP